MVATRLRFSNTERDGLIGLAGDPEPSPALGSSARRRLIYRQGLRASVIAPDRVGGNGRRRCGDGSARDRGVDDVLRFGAGWARAACSAQGLMP
jgi:hypothetical protein